MTTPSPTSQPIPSPDALPLARTLHVDRSGHALTSDNPWRYCLEKAGKEGSSLYYATLFCSAPQKRALVAIAALAAELRDIPRFVQEPKLAELKLAWWRQELASAQQGKAQHPVTRVLGEHLKRFTDPQMDRLLHAASHTLKSPLFFTEKELQAHCSGLSGVYYAWAGSVSGIEDSSALEALERMGAASLELVFWLRIGKSLSDGWHAIPVETLQNHGVPVQHIRNRQVTEQWLAMVQTKGQQAIERGQSAWASMNRAERLKARPMRALWRMRLKEWQLHARSGYPMLTQAMELTPMRKLLTAWTTQALRL